MTPDEAVTSGCGTEYAGAIGCLERGPTGLGWWWGPAGAIAGVCGLMKTCGLVCGGGVCHNEVQGTGQIK
jgi:hypothetical protein